LFNAGAPRVGPADSVGGFFVEFIRLNAADVVGFKDGGVDVSHKFYFVYSLTLK